MKTYEGMFLLHNRELPEEEQAEPEDVVRALIDKCGGTVNHTLIWANRKLAYPVKGNQTGTYVLAYYQGEAALNTELQHQVGISDRCLRLSTFSLDEMPTEYPGPLTDPSARGGLDKDGDEEASTAQEGVQSTKAQRKQASLDRLDYKNVHHLRRMVTAQGKLFSRVRSNLTAQQQRRLRRAVLRARNLALLPFVAR